MFMSVVASVPGIAIYPELAGARVLLTGLTPQVGVDVARAFADHKARLFVQTPALTPEMTELAAVLNENASELKIYDRPLKAPEDGVRLAQAACQAMGGLDVVVNFMPISASEFAGLARAEDIEDLVVEKLTPATHVTRTAANRMRLTWTEGSVLNVVAMAQPGSAQEAALAGLMRTALALMTRAEASAWADHAIRINAIGPRGAGLEPAGACLASEPEIAALALHLASRAGRSLSGHVFDAEQAARCLG